MTREITRACPRCVGGFETCINGLWIRMKRREAHVTLAQAASACRISTSHLSRMERGEEPFREAYVEACERLFARRMRAGEE